MKNSFKKLLPKPLSLYLIWIVPILVLLVAGWMLYREWAKFGDTITIEFEESNGLQAGQTKLKYRGVVVGSVTDIQLRDDLDGVITKVQIEKQAMDLARENTLFWIVQPEIDVSGVSGLETIVSGVHLTARAGDGPRTTFFKGLEQPPPPLKVEQGREFILKSDALGGIRPGAPVIYRQVQVGEVETSQLTEDSTAVLIRIRVYTPYIDLVRTDTKFWNASRDPINVSLFGGNDSSGSSFQSILSGAIAFATPEEYGTVAEAGTEFPLVEEAKNEWIRWKPLISIDPVNDVPEKTLPNRISPFLID